MTLVHSNRLLEYYLKITNKNKSNCMFYIDYLLNITLLPLKTAHPKIFKHCYVFGF